MQRLCVVPIVNNRSPLRAGLWLVRRFGASRANFFEATKNVPRTPDGSNPYDVLELVPTSKTTSDDVGKQFKKLAVLFHPDRQGGSHDKMAELNAAHNIIKGHHGVVVKSLLECEASEAARSANAQRRHALNGQDEDLKRNAGLSVGRQRIRNINHTPASRSPKELQTAWETMRSDAAETTKRIIMRYEHAVEVCVFLRSLSVLSEIAARERWLRKAFMKTVWEDVHELRTELLRKGARNLQMSQLAEEMVTFASDTGKRLDDDFTRQSQLHMQAQIRITAFRCAVLVPVALLCAFIVLRSAMLFYRGVRSLSVSLWKFRIPTRVIAAAAK